MTTLNPKWYRDLNIPVEIRPGTHKWINREQSERDTYLYYCRVTIGRKTFYKIGVTHHLPSRYKYQERKYLTFLKMWRYPNRASAYAEEQRLLREHKAALYTGKKFTRIFYKGSGEFFDSDVLGLDHDSLVD